MKWQKNKNEIQYPYYKQQDFIIHSNLDGKMENDVLKDKDVDIYDDNNKIKNRVESVKSNKYESIFSDDFALNEYVDVFK